MAAACCCCCCLYAPSPTAPLAVLPATREDALALRGCAQPCPAVGVPSLDVCQFPPLLPHCSPCLFRSFLLLPPSQVPEFAPDAFIGGSLSLVPSQVT